MNENELNIDDVPKALDEVLDLSKGDPEFLYWLPIDVNMYEHRKTRRLAAALEIPRPYAVGLIVTFLSKVFKFATSGDITGNRVEEITFWSEYPGNHDFIGAMVTAGFLDEIDGGFRVHKWALRMERFLRKLTRTKKNRERNTKAQRARRSGAAYERARKLNEYAAGDPTYLRKPPKKDGEISTQIGDQITPAISATTGMSSPVAPTPEKERIGVTVSANRSKQAESENVDHQKTPQNEALSFTTSNIPLSRGFSPTRSDNFLHDFEGGQNTPKRPPVAQRMCLIHTNIPRSPTCSACRRHRREENRKEEETKTKAGAKARAADGAAPAVFSSNSNPKSGPENSFTLEKTVDVWFDLYKAHLHETAPNERGYVRAVVARLAKDGSHYSEIQKRMGFWFGSDIPWVKKMHYRLDKFERKFPELAAGPLVKYGDASPTRRPDGGYDKPKGDERTVDDFD